MSTGDEERDVVVMLPRVRRDELLHIHLITHIEVVQNLQSNRFTEHLKPVRHLLQHLTRD